MEHQNLGRKDGMGKVSYPSRGACGDERTTKKENVFSLPRGEGKKKGGTPEDRNKRSETG